MMTSLEIPTMPEVDLAESANPRIPTKPAPSEAHQPAQPATHSGSKSLIGIIPSDPHDDTLFADERSLRAVIDPDISLSLRSCTATPGSAAIAEEPLQDMGTRLYLVSRDTSGERHWIRQTFNCESTPPEGVQDAKRLLTVRAILAGYSPTIVEAPLPRDSANFALQQADRAEWLARGLDAYVDRMRRLREPLAEAAPLAYPPALLAINRHLPFNGTLIWLCTCSDLGPAICTIRTSCGAMTHWDTVLLCTGVFSHRELLWIARQLLVPGDTTEVVALIGGHDESLKPITPAKILGASDPSLPRSQARGSKSNTRKATAAGPALISLRAADVR
jgi:hypothetical protein